MKDKKKISLLMYALGYLGISILTQTTVKWYQYFYAPPEANQGGLRILIPLGLIGITMIVARIFDGIADPLVAYFSDKSKNKKGRRIPFILYGSFPLVLTFILIWFPPIQGESIWNFVYLTFLLSLFFVFFTVVVGPYLALIGEITHTKKERINLTMMQGITQVLGVLVAEAGSGLLIGLSNYKVMGIVLGLFSLGTLILTPIFIKEKPVNIQAQRPMGLFRSLGKTMRNKDFLCYLVPYLGVWFGINTLTIAMPYISEILLGMSPESSGYLVGGAFVVAILFSPFLPKITVRFGKKRVALTAYVSFGIILMCIGLFGTLLNGIAAYIIIFLAGIPLSAALVVPNAMVADIAELDGLRSGHKREGMFFGVQGLVNKLVIGLSSFVTPILFHVFGSTPTSPLGLQLSGPIAGASVIVCSLVLRGYSIPEDEIESVESKDR